MTEAVSEHRSRNKQWKLLSAAVDFLFLMLGKAHLQWECKNAFPCSRVCYIIQDMAMHVLKQHVSLYYSSLSEIVFVIWIVCHEKLILSIEEKCFCVEDWFSDNPGVVQWLEMTQPQPKNRVYFEFIFVPHKLWHVWDGTVPCNFINQLQCNSMLFIFSMLIEIVL